VLVHRKLDYARSMVTGFDHVDRRARSRCGGLRHQLLLDSAPAWRGAHPALGTEGALFTLSNAAIELVAPKTGAEEARACARNSTHGEGLIALAFCVAQAEEFGQALRAPGCAPQRRNRARPRRGRCAAPLSDSSARHAPRVGWACSASSGPT
jgi:hypothetical protein